jgi:hypothetical protein
MFVKLREEEKKGPDCRSVKAIIFPERAHAGHKKIDFFKARVEG